MDAATEQQNTEREIIELRDAINSIAEWLDIKIPNPRYHANLIDWLFDSEEFAVTDIRPGSQTKGHDLGRCEVEALFVKSWTNYRIKLQAELDEYISRGPGIREPNEEEILWGKDISKKLGLP